MDAFGLRNVLLKSADEQSSEFVTEEEYVKEKKTIGKIKIQVIKVKMGFDPPSGCTFLSTKLGSFQNESNVSYERKATRQGRVKPTVAVNDSLLYQTMAYIVAGTLRYLKEVPELVKIGLNALRSNSSLNEELQETFFFCLLRLKSSPEEDAVRMQPGSSETRLFLPAGLRDDVVIVVYDSKGMYCGQGVLQVAGFADELVLQCEKVRSCFIYREPEHEQVGKIKFHINYPTTLDENGHKCGLYAETIAYDCLLETAMKIEQFEQRKLKLSGNWKWLVNEFAFYFGVSDAYTKLRYLSYVMDVATPTSYCLDVVRELLQPVVIRGKTKQRLSHEEVNMLSEVSDQIENMLSLVFENFKSHAFGTATRVAAPALAPALELFKLLHDITSPNVQLKLCRYFENATKKRSRGHLSETDEFASNNTENVLMDLTKSYKKMKLVCLNIQNEILTDIEIHKLDILPSFIDLPKLSSDIYITQLFSRLRTFLVSCPPVGPTPPVVALVIATADFERDLALWNIGQMKGEFDAKELFHMHITLWIKDKRLALLEFCKFDKVKLPSLPTEHSTKAGFIDDIYGRLNEMLAEYDVIISRWPEYSLTLESAIADVEKGAVESLERRKLGEAVC